LSDKPLILLQRFHTAFLKQLLPAHQLRGRGEILHQVQPDPGRGDFTEQAKRGRKDRRTNGPVDVTTRAQEAVKKAVKEL